MTKEEAKTLKAELKYIISSVEGWVTYKDHYNYDMVIKTLDRVKERIIEIIDSALQIEKKFISDALPVSLIGMNADLMKQYLEYVSDRLLVDLGVGKIYNSENPFDFMTNIAIPNKTNFFERRVPDYNKQGVGEKAEDNQFNIDAEF